MDDILIRGGTVVDGTGAAATRADVRVRDGVIAEVGPDLAAGGEPVVDASGALVIPGIIDTHTHLDGAMWWNPALDPLPVVRQHVDGVRQLRQLDRAARRRSSATRSSTSSASSRTSPSRPSASEVPWTWEDVARVRHARSPGNPPPCNVGGYLGHLSLRTFVMGADAWERAATPDEVARMAARARRRSRRRRDGPVGEPLRQGPHAAARARLLRRRRRVPRAVRRGRPAPPRHGAGDHALQRSRPRRRGRRALRSPLPRSGRPRPVAGHADERPRRRPPGPRVEGPPRAAGRAGSDFWPVVPFKPLAPFFGFERSIVFQRVAGVERGGQRARRRQARRPSPILLGATGRAPTGTTARARRSRASTVPTR